MMGYKLVNNYGNYGAYGWGLGAWHYKAVGPRDLSEITIQIGPFKVMWRKKNG